MKPRLRCSQACRTMQVTNPFTASGAGDGDKSSYVNLASHSEAHRGASASLEDLYGDRAVWIQANQGLMGRRAAANLWAASQGRM